ncbi:MAG: molybdopterin molybdotransferase, partial [Subtercola sp.]|nr:molybdopterin molybdotransferase [Subtercola sp.]
ARLPGGCLLLGLPGNPLAALVALVVLGHPLLAGFAGEPLPPVSRIETRDALEGRAGAVLLSPFRLVDGRAVLNAFTGSAMMRGLADADGLLVCPASGAPAGATLEALPVPWSA